MKDNKNTTGRYKDILAIQSSYNNHIHYIRLDKDGNGTWAGHAQYNKKLTEDELNENAKNWYNLINRDWSKDANPRDNM